MNPPAAADRQQELLVLVVAAVAADEAGRHRFRRTCDSPLQRRFAPGDPAPFAVRQAAVPDRRRPQGVGLPRHLRNRRRKPAAAVAFRRRGACACARAERRNAFRLHRTAYATADEHPCRPRRQVHRDRRRARHRAHRRSVDRMPQPLRRPRSVPLRHLRRCRCDVRASLLPLPHDGVPLPDAAARYRDTMLALPAMQQWAADARVEPWSLPQFEVG